MRSRNEYRLSWDEFDNLCIELAHKVKNLQFDRIVGVSRGGLPIAGYLSKLFGMKDTTALSMAGQEPWPWQLRNALIVDDVFCTGKTFQIIEKRIDCTNNCHFAALYKQDNCSGTDKYIYVRETTDWIVFPTETISITRK